MSRTGGSEFPETGLPSIDALMRRYVAEHRSAGMVTLVSRGGRLQHFNCHGHADLEGPVAVRHDTIFRIFSMTKPITSAALMLQVEQGKADLDDAARRWIPALGRLEVDGEGPLVRDITLRHLLTHTAGFSYGFDPDNNPIDRHYAEIWRTPFHALTLSQLMVQLLEIPLIAQPGSRWHYSIATDVCGYLVELLTDMPLADYLQQTFFTPLDMPDTGFIVPPDKQARFATLYGLRDDDPMAQLEFADNSPYIESAKSQPKLHSGGGGLVSTAGDYWRFAQMMLNRGEFEGRRYLAAETVAQMTRNQLDPALLPLSFNGVSPDAHMGYGFGLGYCVTIDTERSAAAGSQGDFGWGGLADTYCWVDPARDLVAILMQQFMPSLHHPGRRDFRDAVYVDIAD